MAYTKSSFSRKTAFGTVAVILATGVTAAPVAHAAKGHRTKAEVVRMVKAGEIYHAGSMPYWEYHRRLREDPNFVSKEQIRIAKKKCRGAIPRNIYFEYVKNGLGGAA